MRSTSAISQILLGFAAVSTGVSSSPSGLSSFGWFKGSADKAVDCTCGEPKRKKKFSTWKHGQTGERERGGQQKRIEKVE